MVSLSKISLYWVNFTWKVLQSWVDSNLPLRTPLQLYNPVLTFISTKNEGGMKGEKSKYYGWEKYRLMFPDNPG